METSAFGTRLRRRAFSGILLLVFATAACKGRHDRITVVNEEPDTGPRMLSLIHMNDAGASPQLLSGFYGIEAGAWRWTAGKFSVLLRTPLDGAQRGAVLTLAFSIPDPAMKRPGNITLTASLNGTELNRATYDKTGSEVFTADVPPTMLTTEVVKIDFTLNKTIPPGADKRELGIVANSVGLSSK